MRHTSNTGTEWVQSRAAETVETRAGAESVSAGGEVGGDQCGSAGGCTASELGPSLRILGVIHTLRREAGGTADAVLRSSTALLALGHYIEVVTADPLGTAAPSGVDFPFHPLGELGRATLGGWLQANRDRFDVVIVHGLWQAAHVVRSALKRSRTPYFVFPHGMLDPILARLYPVKHLKKQLYWWWREGRALREAAAVCFTCEEERRLARNSFRPYTVNERVVAFGAARPEHNVDAQASQRAFFLEKFPVLRGRDFLLFLGRLHHKKGLHELIEGFAKFRGAKRVGESVLPTLVIAGPCSEPKLLRALMRHAARLGLAQLNLRGEDVEVPHSNSEASADVPLIWLPMLGDDLKWGALLASEAFVLSSHQENFGIAVAEALACGRPVLISDKVNIWREIAEARAGLVAPDTVEGVVDLLTRWAALSADARSAMSAAAIACFETNFEITRAAESLVQTLRECLVDRATQ